MKRASVAAVALYACLTSFCALGSTIHVPKDQPTIQAGIDAANPGDTVLVAPGKYIENIDFKGKAITVTSSSGPKTTVIDGGQIAPVATFATGEGASSILSGFTLQNGMSGFVGGGIYIDLTSPTIRHNVIQNNLASDGGGGIGVLFGSPIIEKNIIRNNAQLPNSEGGVGGGGISVGGAGPARIVGNQIENNTWPGSGGGISLDASGTTLIKDNVIRFNSAEWNPPTVYSQGGGIVLVNDSSPLIIQNLIVANRATQGGGIYMTVPEGQNPLLVNNTIAGAPDLLQGEAVWVGGFADGIQFFNNIFVGFSSMATSSLVYCDGTYDQQPPTFTDNDIHSLKETGLIGTCANQKNQNGNITANPRFINPSKNDYRLRRGSPAINAGDNSAPDLPKKDLAGHPRIVGGTIDMGAYEYQGKK